MPTLKEIERVFVCETNAVVSPPAVFPTSLPPGGTVDLCKLTVPVGRERNAFLVHALVDWSFTVTPPATQDFVDIPGFAQVTFELLRDGGPIFSVTDTANEAAPSIFTIFVTTTTTFVTTTLLHLDTTSIGGTVTPLTTFTLRATNIILTPPVLLIGITPATVTAAAGAVSLVVEEVEACRAQSLTV